MADDGDEVALAVTLIKNPSEALTKGIQLWVSGRLVAADALAGLTDKPATLVFPATVRPTHGAVLLFLLLLL